MKIGLIGAPGSGKSKLARRLVAQRGWSHNSTIDNYVPSLAGRTKLAYGPYANYIDNMQVIFKRRELELRRGDNRITCGTVIDSNAHAFLVTDATATRETLPYLHPRLDAIMKAFGFLYTESFDYDYAFYLPYQGEVAFARKLDEAIRATIEAYFAPVIVLESTSSNEQAEAATNIITELEAPVAVTTPDESGVRSGGGDGEDQRDSAESVPNLS